MDKNKTKHEDHRTTLLEWQTPEFVATPRGKLWFIIAGALLTLIVIYGLLSDNLTMAIVFIMLAVVFMLVEKREPKTVRMIISDMGIEYRGKFYPYHQINAFWLVYHPPYVQLLYLRARVGRKFVLLRIELNGKKPQKVRELLLKEVPEIEGAHEPTVDILTRVLKLH